MHEAVFEARWAAADLLSRHRATIAAEHRHKGREVIGRDWTVVHHERGPAIDGTTQSYDYVERRVGRFQTVVTAVGANRARIDGIAVQGRAPSQGEAEMAYLKAIVRESYEQMAEARQRLLRAGAVSPA